MLTNHEIVDYLVTTSLKRKDLNLFVADSVAMAVETNSRMFSVVVNRS